ncbi:MAG TPA: hypothetical protein VFT13_12605 [Candidatus Krumholzibacteria bacterium]|nr:hypothetical protein [Candidatus Krumholzibacteria bacterium]
MRLFRLPTLLPLTIALSVVAVFGCSDLGDPVDPTTPTPEVVSFSEDIQPIFNSRCAIAGCHVQPAPTGGLDLTEGQSWANLVGVRAQSFPGERVVAGSPAGSVLYLLVETGSMPQVGGPLSTAQIELIRKWIADGALNN